MNIDDKYLQVFEQLSDSKFAEISALLKDSAVSGIAAAVRTESARLPSAAYPSPVYNISNSESNISRNGKSEIDRLIGELNKPIQITLDGKVISETVLNYSFNKQRSTGK